MPAQFFADRGIEVVDCAGRCKFVSFLTALETCGRLEVLLSGGVEKLRVASQRRRLRLAAAASSCNKTATCDVVVVPDMEVSCDWSTAATMLDVDSSIDYR
jgi:hypothetical protein